MQFAGISAFPLTPFAQNEPDFSAVETLLERLGTVDSIGILGSTGSALYLTPAQRQRIVSMAVQTSVPVLAGVGAVSLREVLNLSDAAVASGAQALLVPPFSYQPLTPSEVMSFYSDVTERVGAPVVVYDNPSTTGFNFTDDMYAELASMPGIAAIKAPPSKAAHIPQLGIPVGISGDAAAQEGLRNGAACWFSAIAGLVPEFAHAVVAGLDAQALWCEFVQHGSLRVVAALAHHLGYAQRDCLPRPVRPLNDADYARVIAAWEGLDFVIS